MARYPQKTFEHTLNSDFIIEEANGMISREQILLYRGVAVKPGTVLGKITASGLYKPLDLAATDGSQNAAGILVHGRDALAGADTRRAPAIVRHADANGHKLVWPAGITVNQRKAAEAQLAALSVLVRY